MREGAIKETLNDLAVRHGAALNMIDKTKLQGKMGRAGGVDSGYVWDCLAVGDF
ncbi:hypothetical protein ACI2J4_10770 [Agrobacterium tumefaciens]|uniref:hypothetical protein n=1 Tax=Agrobacterium tumefaciens TaxID=358 RepID=UPI00384C4431